jgi:hypothetical protein
MRTSSGSSWGADRAHALFLDHAQQLHLQVQRQLGDLVEEQRAAVARLEQAFLVGVRAGEAALAWPNSSLSISSAGIAPQFTGTKGPVAARALLVDQARHQFLAHARTRRRCRPGPGCGQLGRWWRAAAACARVADQAVVRGLLLRRFR